MKRNPGCIRPSALGGLVAKPIWLQDKNILIFEMKNLLISILLLSQIAVLPVFCETQNNVSDFNLLSLSTGKRVSLADLNGEERNVLILSFFNTSCEPCLKEIPHLQKIQEKYATKALKIYLISIDTVTSDRIKEFIAKNNVTLPVLMDPYGIQTGEKYGVLKGNIANLPRLYLITKNLAAAKVIEGLKENLEEILNPEIDKLLEEKPQPLPTAEDRSITIFYSNSTNGNIKSCDCPSNPFGGLTRRATVIEDLTKDKKNYLIVDTGDMFPAYPNELQADYIVRAMEIIPSDYLILGDQDLLLGMDYTKKMLKKTKLKFLSANLSYCEDKKCLMFAKGWDIRQIGNYKIGIIGLTNEKCFTFFPKKIKESLKVQPATDTLKGFVENFRNSTDLLVVLSHSGYDDDVNYARNIQGIDVIIGGHSQTLLKDPMKIDSTIVCQAGANGQYLGKLRIFFDKNNKIASYDNTLIALSKDIKDNTEILDIHFEYNQKLSTLNRQHLPTQTMPPMPLPQQQSQYTSTSTIPSPTQPK